MAKEFMCMICDQPERSCSCNKYCALCQSLYEVRLCEDGIYYCRPCREACDLRAQVGGKSASWQNSPSTISIIFIDQSQLPRNHASPDLNVRLLNADRSATKRTDIKSNSCFVVLR